MIVDLFGAPAALVGGRVADLDELVLEEEAALARSDVVVGRRDRGAAGAVRPRFWPAPAEQLLGQRGRCREHRRRDVVGVDLVAGEEQLVGAGGDPRRRVGELAMFLEQPVDDR